MASRCDRRMQIAALCEPPAPQQQRLYEQRAYRNPEETGLADYLSGGRADERVAVDQTRVPRPSLPPLAMARVSARRLDTPRDADWSAGLSAAPVAAAQAGAQAGASGKAPSKKRSRRLSNSERGKLYRSRRKNYVQTLEEQVGALQKEVADLSMYERTQRASLQLTREPVRGSFARIVCEYFSLFEHGVPVVGDARSSSSSNGSNTLLDVPREHLARSSRQASFLHSLMHPDMVFGSSYGVQTLLDQWEKYSLFHAGLRYKVTNLELVVADPHPVVLAPATLNVRFTRRTIEEVFPHVLWNEELVQKLIGMEVEYPVGNTFYFGADDKIHRYDTRVDFVAAFMSSLGSIKDCMTLLESAQIKHDAMLGELLEEPRPATTADKACVEELTGSDSDGGGAEAAGGGVGARIGMSLESIL